jgi:hypothetical protein
MARYSLIYQTYSHDEQTPEARPVGDPERVIIDTDKDGDYNGAKTAKSVASRFKFVHSERIWDERGLGTERKVLSITALENTLSKESILST